MYAICKLFFYYSFLAHKYTLRVRRNKGKGKMNELALFAGAGGGILGGQLLGWRTVCAVEIEPYAAGVLLARQNDGILPPFPIWDDILTFDGRPWRGIVDVVSGGFPCQDISCAGKGAGLDGERSGLWREMRRILCEVRPSFALVENSPMLVSRGLGYVLRDLAEMGYDAEWGCICASETGAPHRRERIWIVAYADSVRPQGQRSAAGGAWSKQQFEGLLQSALQFRLPSGKLGGFSDGVAGRMGMLKALGNGQVPAVAATAWHVLCQRIGPKK